MTTAAITSLVHNPMLLPPREAPYLLHAVHELLSNGCRTEIVLDWSDSHLFVRVDADSDTLHADFHDYPFVPSEAFGNLGACSPWDGQLGKECDWTWVAVNQQGYCDLLVFSFDVMVPNIMLHALASSIEVFEVKGKKGN